MSDGSSPRVVLFNRAAVSGARTRQREVRERLATLEEAGRIADVTHHGWLGRVRRPVDGNGPAARSVAWYDRFERWADEADVDLAPFFESSERVSELADETYEEIVLPVLCLAVLRDGRIETVVPHTDDGETTTVEDCLDALESGRSPVGDGDTDAAGPAASHGDSRAKDRNRRPVPAGE